VYKRQELLNAEGLAFPVLHLGLPDSFQHHASREDLLAEAGLDVDGIRAAVLRRWPVLARDGQRARSAAG
jgi:1-deoxy-D-xylulose-5-phosphate synthase